MRPAPRTATCALLLLCATAAQADLPRVSERERWGVGFMLGAPTGLNAKHWLGGPDAFDLGFAFTLGPGVRFHADYLWGLARVPESTGSVDIDIYMGVGPLLGIYRGACSFIGNDRCGGGEVYAGGRIPFGAEAVFKRTPFAVAIELAPGVAASSSGAGFLLDITLMARLLL